MSFGAPIRNGMFRRLPVEEAISPQYGGRHRLRVVYRTWDLVVLGLGVMIGAGIFQIAGVQAATTAGPAVILSFVIAGVICLLSALSYAEMSSTIPVAGSAYSFIYVAFGELWAWVVGWALILELQLATAVVARAWSLYAVQLINDVGALTGLDWFEVPSALSDVVGRPAGFDLFAPLILIFLIVIVAIGARLSLYTLWLLVLTKVIVIGLVIAGGLLFFRPDNLTPFVPAAQPVPAAGGADRTVIEMLIGGAPHSFGLLGVFAATTAIAFAYIGFDLIATAAEETEDPRRKVPAGIITSLVIAIALYVGVAIAMAGMVSYRDLDPQTPLTKAFTSVGADWMGLVIDIGAVIGLATVILVVLVSQTRVVFSMARDRLLPRPLAEISPAFRVPSKATLVTGCTAIALSQIDVITFGRVNVLTLEQMIVIGTLFAFVFVSAGVLFLRGDRPDLARGFRVPGSPVTPALAILATGWLMFNLNVRTWLLFGAWMVLGVIIYLLYGRRHSRLRELLGGARPARHPGRHARL